MLFVVAAAYFVWSLRHHPGREEVASRAATPPADDAAPAKKAEEKAEEAEEKAEKAVKADDEADRGLRTGPRTTRPRLTDFPN